MVSISILAVLADRDLKKLGAQQRPKEFQSSRSLRTATHVGPALAVRQEISILAVLADRDRIHDAVRDHLFVISILAVLADRNIYQQTRLRYPIRYFNPCGPCGPRQPACPAQRSDELDFNPRGPCGPRPLVLGDEFSVQIFQSSRSLRTATPACWLHGSVGRHFNPRGPCGPRPPACWLHGSVGRHFNPRGPCGPRPKENHGNGNADGISILAVLADRDFSAAPPPYAGNNFNPRGPCGPRLHQE